MKRNVKLYLSLLITGAASFCAADQLSDRLIGWWKLDDATNATVLADSSGSGRDASFGSGTTIVDNGRFGRCAYFDGTGDAWARFANPEMTNMTIAAWVFMEAFNNIYPRVMQIGPDVFYHMPEASPGQFTFGFFGNYWTTSSTIPFKFETNQWFHAAVVYQQRYTNATERVVWPVFYINGVRCGYPVTEKAFVNPVSSGYAYFGNNSSNGVRPLEGFMDDVRLYDAALSDRDILAIYQNKPLKVDAGVDQSVSRDQTTLQGSLISTNSFMNCLDSKITWSAISSPAGDPPVFSTPAVAVTEVTLPEIGAYTFRITAESELGTSIDEVTVTRESTSPGGNSAPIITPDFTSIDIVLGEKTTLTTEVTDDATPGTVRLRWSTVSGPSKAFFETPFEQTSAVEFFTNGTFVVRLEADDGYAQSTQDITVNVDFPEGDITDGLEHWWSMDDDAALSSTSDCITNNTLEFRYQAILQPGRSGNALRATRLAAVAVADYLPTNAATMTFSAWIYYDGAYVDPSSGNRYQRVFCCSGPNFYILYDPVIKKISMSSRGIGTGSTQYTWSWGSVLEYNQWHHIAILFDRRALDAGSRQTMYVNGEKVLSGTLSTAFPGGAAWSGDFLVGNLNAYGGGTRNFDGVIDDARVYSRFITDEEAGLLAVDPGINHAPVITVQSALSAKTSQTLELDGSVVDDNRPDYGSLETTWSVVSGDTGAVSFVDASDPGTSVVITKTGEYTLMLHATDGEQDSASLVMVNAVASGTLFLVN